MQFVNSKKIQLVAELYFENFCNKIDSNCDIEQIQKEYCFAVIQNFEDNLLDDNESKNEIDDRIQQCLIYYKELLNNRYKSIQ